MRAAPFLIAAAMVAAAIPAQAQVNRDAEIAAIRAEMARLSQRLDQLERGETAPPAAVPAPASTPQDMSVGAGDSSVLILAEADRRALTTRTAIPATLDRPLQADASSPRNGSPVVGLGFELGATTDTSSVAVRLSRTVSGGGPDFDSFTTLALTASAPLASSGPSDLGTLDGFVNSSKLRFQFSRYIRRVSSPSAQPGYAALVERFRVRCRARGGPAADCDSSIFRSDLFNTYAPELETEFIALGHMTPGPDPRVDWSAHAYGLEAAVGYRKFNYLLAQPARFEQQVRVPWSAKAFFSWLPDVRRDSWTGALEYQRSFKEGTSGTICPANPTGVEQACLTGALGSPALTERLIASLEYRRLLRFGENAFLPSIGLSAMFSYDTLNNNFGFDLPVYLAANADGQLTGGIRFGYRSNDNEKDDYVLGVFVGTAFSLR